MRGSTQGHNPYVREGTTHNCYLTTVAALLTPFLTKQISVILANGEKVVGVFQGNNPPEQIFDVVGSATAFVKG